MPKTYNGHPSWAYWNVALWIGNDEGLYRLARDLTRSEPNRDRAARAMLAALNESGQTATPDGAKYSISNLKAALRGLDD